MDRYFQQSGILLLENPAWYPEIRIRLLFYSYILNLRRAMMKFQCLMIFSTQESPVVQNAFPMQYGPPDRNARVEKEKYTRTAIHKIPCPNCGYEAWIRQYNSIRSEISQSRTSHRQTVPSLSVMQVPDTRSFLTINATKICISYQLSCSFKTWLPRL